MSLGESYLGKFNIGDYVHWRVIIRDSNYDEYYKEQWGVITNFQSIENSANRNVWYAVVLENKTGKTIPVLIHKIRKVETN